MGVTSEEKNVKVKKRKKQQGLKSSWSKKKRQPVEDDAERLTSTQADPESSSKNDLRQAFGSSSPLQKVERGEPSLGTSKEAASGRRANFALKFLSSSSDEEMQNEPEETSAAPDGKEEGRAIENLTSGCGKVLQESLEDEANRKKGKEDMRVLSSSTISKLMKFKCSQTQEVVDKPTVAPRFGLPAVEVSSNLDSGLRSSNSKAMFSDSEDED